MTDGVPGHMPALKAEGVAVSLGGRRVLSGVSLEVGKGQVVGLIGPNGSGKSTLLRAMSGLLALDAGMVRLGGDDVSAMKPAERAGRVAYMPQSGGRHPFTALETVLMARYSRLGRFGIEGRADRDAAVKAMELAGVTELADRNLDTLSGGERQRVMLARALAQDAGVLALDEPTASLDLKHRLAVMDVLKEAATEEKGAAIVVAVHDLSLAARYCDRLVLLSAGRVSGSGTPEEVLTPSGLRAAFDVETVIEPDTVTGKPQVTLLGPAGKRAGAAGEGVRVHVICGAGSGRDLLHQLVSGGYTVTACVLGQGDTDREAAERLKVEFVPAPPFSMISAEEDSRHRALAGAADFVVLCDMAVGRNNLANLRAAATAKRLLIVEGRTAAELDYTGGEGAVVFESLVALGTRVARPDVLRALARAGGSSSP